MNYSIHQGLQKFDEESKPNGLQPDLTRRPRDKRFVKDPASRRARFHGQTGEIMGGDGGKRDNDRGRGQANIE